MLRNEFVNRKTELDYLRAELGHISDANKVLFLEGATGVGKSSLTRKLLAEQGRSRAVKLPALATTHQEGDYVARLAETIDKQEQGHGSAHTFAAYLSRLPSSTIRRRYNHLLITEFTKSALSPASALLPIRERKAQLGRYDPELVFRSVDSEATLVSFDYLRDTLSANRYIVNIENFQAIDTTSLNLVARLAQDHNRHCFILEITVGDSDLPSVDELAQPFRHAGCEVARLRLDKLPLEDLLSLLTDKDLRALVKELWISYEGNLRKLRDLDVVVLSQGRPAVTALSTQEADPTYLRVQSLPRSEIFTLALIVAHRSSVERELFQHLYAPPAEIPDPTIDFQLCLDHLAGAGLVVSTGSRVSVEHDHVAASYERHEDFQKYLILARRNWTNVYQALFDAGDFSFISKSEVLGNLFLFLSKVNPPGCFVLLPEIKAVAQNSLYPKTALSLLENLAAALRDYEGPDSNSLIEVSEFLLDLYYELGLFEDALAVLEHLPVDRLKASLLKVALLDRVDRHEEALALGELLLRTYATSDIVCLIVHLIQLTSLRSLNRFGDAAKLLTRVLRKKAYKELPEYGYLLRNSQFLLSMREGLKNLRESVNFFRQRRLEIAEAHSRIGLGMRLIELGQVEDGLVEFKASEDALQGRSMERHVLLNNEAVALGYRSPPQLAEALSNLMNARYTLTTNFDWIAVLNNMAIVASRLQQHAAYQETAQRLEELLVDQPDLIIHRITYFNLAYAARQVGLAEVASRFSARARSISFGSGEYENYWAHRLEGARLSGDSFRFIASHPFEPVFISYWHFPIPEASRLR